MNTEFRTNISLIANPNSPDHVINVKYLEEYVAGKVKMPVRVASATNIAGVYNATAKTLTYGATGVAVIDGVTLVEGNRVLVAMQTDGTQNGIYIVTFAGDVSTEAVLTRAADFDADDKVYSGVRVTVNEGTLYADTAWKLTTDGVIVLDTTALDFVQIGASVGTAKHAETITGDNTTDVFLIEHNLGSSDVSVSIRNLTKNANVIADVSIVDNDSVGSYECSPKAAVLHHVS